MRIVFSRTHVLRLKCESQSKQNDANSVYVQTLYNQTVDVCRWYRNRTMAWNESMIKNVKGLKQTFCKHSGGGAPENWDSQHRNCSAIYHYVKYGRYVPLVWLETALDEPSRLFHVQEFEIWEISLLFSYSILSKLLKTIFNTCMLTLLIQLIQFPF